MNFMRIQYLAEAYGRQLKKLKELVDPKQDPSHLILGKALAAMDRQTLPSLKAKLELELALFRVLWRTSLRSNRKEIL